MTMSVYIAEAVPVFFWMPFTTRGQSSLLPVDEKETGSRGWKPRHWQGCLPLHCGDNSTWLEAMPPRCIQPTNFTESIIAT